MQSSEPTALINGREYTRDEFIEGITMARTTEVGEITLGGKEYTFRKPKTAILMAALMQSKGKSKLEATQIMAEMQLKWIRAGVGKAAWAEIEQRLMDDDDDLDWQELDDIFKTKTAQQRPTTSSSDSSTQQSKTTPSEDEPKPTESIFGI